MEIRKENNYKITLSEIEYEILLSALEFTCNECDELSIPKYKFVELKNLLEEKK